MTGLPKAIRDFSQHVELHERGYLGVRVAHRVSPEKCLSIQNLMPWLASVSHFGSCFFLMQFTMHCDVAL